MYSPDVTYVPKTEDVVFHKYELTEPGLITKVEEYIIYPKQVLRYTITVKWLHGGMSGLMDSLDVVDSIDYLRYLQASDHEKYEQRSKDIDNLRRKQNAH